MRFAVLVLVVLASCDATPSPVPLTSERDPVGNEERKISGVLTLYREGSSFKECPLQQPWNCAINKAPECGLEATPEGDRTIKAAIDKAGAYRFATFGVVMIGKRIDGITPGHMNGHNCGFHARVILEVNEVPSVPPAS